MAPADRYLTAAAGTRRQRRSERPKGADGRFREDIEGKD